MARLVSLASGVLPDAPHEEIPRIAAEAGFAATGLWVDPDDGWTDAKQKIARRHIEASGIVPLDVEVIWIKEGDAPSDAHRRIIAAGGELGARNALIVSSHPDPAATRRIFASLSRLCADAGMRAVLEFLMITEVRTLDQALAILRDVGDPNAGVLIDALHVQRAGVSLDEVAALDPALTPYMQLCDGVERLIEPDFEAYLADARDGRSCPGEGGLPLEGLMAALPEGVPVSLEVRSTALYAEFPDFVARAKAVRARSAAFLDRLGAWR